MITFTIFHMLGMSSSCSNPFLYGFLNDNFVKEFQILCPLKFPSCDKFLANPSQRNHKIPDKGQNQIAPQDMEGKDENAKLVEKSLAHDTEIECPPLAKIMEDVVTESIQLQTFNNGSV